MDGDERWRHEDEGKKRRREERRKEKEEGMEGESRDALVILNDD